MQQQHKLLLEERQQEIAALLTMVDLAHIDDKPLMGGLLFLKEKITTQDPVARAWRDASEKFLRQHKLKSQHGGHWNKAEKQGNNCQQISKQVGINSQASDKRGIPPKPTPAAQTTNQSSQEYPQPGEA